MLSFVPSVTNRGFVKLKFTDRYHSPCSVQESSSAEAQCIWLGIDDPNPQVMAVHAEQFGITTHATNGWVPYPIPPEVNLTTRMHLTREDAGALAKLLQRFADTGELEP